jgi:uncharacterized protein
MKDRAFNAPLWAAIGIPAITVLASAITLVLAYRGADVALPAQYVTEGAALDADLARAVRARELGIGLALDFEAGDLVRVRYRSARGAAAPNSMRLRLTHAVDAAHDRDLSLVRVAGSEQEFTAHVQPLERGRWLVQIDDGAGAWRLRGAFGAPPSRVGLGLGPPP